VNVPAYNQGSKEVEGFSEGMTEDGADVTMYGIKALIRHVRSILLYFLFHSLFRILIISP